MPAWSTSVMPSSLPRTWREWLWLVWWSSLALLTTAAAVSTEIASKRDASAARLPGQAGSLTYDAGWPLAYAHTHRTDLDSAAWNTAIHGMAAAINWPIFIVDCVILALLFNMWIALIIALWRITLRLRRDESWRDMVRAALIGTAVVAVWAGVSAGVIANINQTQPTDATAQAQILQPLHLVLLAPGVIGYVVQRWFESDVGANISLTGGIANGVESLAVMALALVLPAALLTMATLLIRRIARLRQKTEETLT